MRTAGWVGCAVGLVVMVSASRVAAENWPRFRGPTGQGLSTEVNLPVEWSTEKNLAWRQAIPGDGWSSPIVWDDRVFVTTATEGGKECRLLALDRDTGRILWNCHVLTQQPGRKEDKNSYATPTPCTDGEGIYCCFAQGGLAVVSWTGKVLWTNLEYPFYSKHGLGASPIVVGERLIMPFDGSSSGPDLKIGWQIPWDKAFLVALDVQTGKEVWRTARGLSRVSHMTPLVVPVDGRDQLISPAGDRIQGFDPESGRLIWSVYSQGEGVTPSPATNGRLLFTSSGFEATTLRTVRLGEAQGDVTATHIAWEQKKGAPTQPSLTYVAPYVYAVTDAGVMTCYAEATGEVVWQDRLEGKYSASPVVADGRLYIVSEDGETVVVAPGDTFRVLARNRLEGRFQASPAVSQERLFLRSDQHLYCVQELTRP